MSESLRIAALGWACSQYAQSLLLMSNRSRPNSPLPSRFLILYYLLCAYASLHFGKRGQWKLSTFPVVMSFAYASVFCVFDEVVLHLWGKMMQTPSKKITRYILRGNPCAGQATCCVCLDDTSKETVESFCKTSLHPMHPTCATMWYIFSTKSMCPMCKEHLRVNRCTLSYDYPTQPQTQKPTSWFRFFGKSTLTFVCVAGACLYKFRKL
jgi:hypothetical protein